jgi:tetratricopeptide (TPR) repeat protein
MRRQAFTSLEIFLAFVLASAVSWAEEPVGLVFEARNATIQRPGRGVSLAAVPGFPLFSGDVLHAESGSVRFSFCPTKSAQTVTNASLTLDSSGIGLHQLQDRYSLQSCSLALLDRLPSLDMSPRRPPALAGTFAERVRQLPQPTQTRTIEALAAIDRAGSDRSIDPHNSEIQLAAARASLLENSGLLEDAMSAYDAMHQRWPDIEWVVHAASRVAHQADRESADRAFAARGVKSEPLRDVRGGGPPIDKTYAVVVGISQYRMESGIPWLSFADRDAETFAQHLEQPRGGSLRRCTDANPSDCEIRLLTNGSATQANIVSVFHTFVREHAASSHALIVFLAAHGVDPAKDWVGNQALNKEPMVLAHDSDYNETKVTGYPMSQLREELAEQGLQYGKVVLYLDVCRAGNIGSIAGTSEMQPAVREVFTFRKGSVGLFMASQAQDDAYESSQFGSGHGAFTYSVLHTLNAGSPSTRTTLDFGELLAQVTREVRDLTLDQQVPEGRAVDQRMIVQENLSLPGLQLDPAYPIGNKKALRRPRGARPSAPKNPRDGSPPSVADDFLKALAAGRLRRDEGPGNAREALAAIVGSADSERAHAYAEMLRVALEDRGQRVILAYLRGDQEPQTRDQFETGAKDFAAALELDPRMAFDESRMLFCQGRALIFPDRANQKDYGTAGALLERSIRLDPGRAYSYNALGIAYLEQIPTNPAFYDRAVAAFQDAIQRAPYWPYPWHNLALVLAERGNYDGAAANYRHAMTLAPQYSYLPYNLALLYQRIHRSEDAEEYYKRAIGVAREAYKSGTAQQPSGRKPEEAEANNALGTLAEEDRNSSRARHYYRAAIKLDPDCLSAGHNLALLESVKPGPSTESERLWAGNLKLDPLHLPSLMGRAAYFSRQARWNEAIQDWTKVLQQVPENLNARLQLARAYIAAEQSAMAAPLLKAAESHAITGASAWEQIGELYSSLGDFAGARHAWEQALEAARLSSERSLVRLLGSKLASLPAAGVK